MAELIEIQLLKVDYSLENFN